MATKLLYMDDFGVVTCQATIQNIAMLEDGHWDVVLDQTCFYPRGGGQDWDTGVLQADSGTITVDEVRLDEAGVVHHYGQIEGSISAGQFVKGDVDQERREINTRLHSAGHVIDMAVDQLGLGWIPGRGAHYPHMSFVEYEATADDAEQLRAKIQRVAQTMTQGTVDNELRYVSRDELATLCRHVPENLPTNKPIRVVLYGDFGVPCGGTHVKRLSAIGTIEVTKVKSKKGTTKVSYRVDGIN